MNILAIGNSFSEDATRYLHDIAKADGENLQVVNLYIGGCSLERHYRNMLSGDRVYELQYNGQKTGFCVSLKEALLNRKWDIVTVQQASILSFVEESYEPYASALSDFVCKYAPKAKLYLHQTWSYEDGSDRLINAAGFESYEKMQSAVTDAYSKIANTIGADGIIPSGELFNTLLKRGVPKVHRDTFHASFGLGRYALALLWYHTLYKRQTRDNSFADFDEPISELELRLAKECVDSFAV